VGQSLASLKIKLKGNGAIGHLRQKLKVICNKPADAVPCDPYGPLPCLFDISTDPCEFNNLAEKMPAKVDELLDLIEEYREVAVTPLNVNRVLFDQRSTPLFWNCTISPWLDASHPWNPNSKSNCAAPSFPQPLLVEPRHA